MRVILYFLLIQLLVTSAYALNKKIYVYIDTQTIKAYENDIFVMEGNISSGMLGSVTPEGNYTITEKRVDHVSNLWPKPNGGAEMPFMMRLDGTAYALHLGNLPGYPASHGCVRIEDGFSQKLYEWAPIGTQVLITGETPSRKDFKVHVMKRYLSTLSREKKTSINKIKKPIPSVMFSKIVLYSKGDNCDYNFKKYNKKDELNSTQQIDMKDFKFLVEEK